MHPALQSLAHRPWPLPEYPWKWRQSWLDLAFIHYPIASQQIQNRLPKGLKLQEFNGSAWLGLVPFRMADVMFRDLPALPIFSNFPELNLRTYVEYEGKPGVFFFSLDAASWPIVLGGRMLYNLPYFRASMQHQVQDEWHQFISERYASQVSFQARYRPYGPIFQAQINSFEHWLTERYCLYSYSKARGIQRVEVHHAPWPLQQAEVMIEHCDILQAAGFTPLQPEPICHFSKGVQVISF